MKALSVDHKQRYRSMEAFSAALLEEAGANTAVFRPEAPPRPAEKPAAASPKQFSPPMVLLAVLLAVSVIGNVLLALWNSGAFDGKEQPATPVMERSLEGYYLPAIEDKLEQMSGYNFIYRYEYSDTYPSGVIYKQSLAVGQVLPEDGSVTLYISKGPQYTVMPDLYGANEAYAIRILTDCQISYTIVYDTNPETGGEPGTVVGTSIAPGSPVGPRTAAEVDTVTVTIKGASEEPFYG